jgi:hypothetical protein
MPPLGVVANQELTELGREASHRLAPVVPEPGEGMWAGLEGSSFPGPSVL